MIMGLALRILVGTVISVLVSGAGAALLIPLGKRMATARQPRLS